MSNSPTTPYQIIVTDAQGHYIAILNSTTKGQFTAQPGQTYKLIGLDPESGQPWLLDNLVVLQDGTALIVQFLDGSEVEISDFYAAETQLADGSWSVTDAVSLEVPTDDGLTSITSNTPVTTQSVDGLQIIYQHKSDSALTKILLAEASGDTPLDSVDIDLLETIEPASSPGGGLLPLIQSHGAVGAVSNVVGTASSVVGAGSIGSAVSNIAATAGAGSITTTAAELVNVIGKVVLGPVISTHGLKLQAYQQDGTYLGEVDVKEDGHYTIDVLPIDYKGLVLLQVSDHNDAADYSDEATGQDQDLVGDLRAVFYANGENSYDISINPITEIAVRELGLEPGDRAQSETDLSELPNVKKVIEAADDEAVKNIADNANNNVAKAFGLDGINLLTTTPAAVNDPFKDYASQEGDKAKLYGAALAIESAIRELYDLDNEALASLFSNYINEDKLNVNELLDYDGIRNALLDNSVIKGSEDAKTIINTYLTKLATHYQDGKASVIITRTDEQVSWNGNGDKATFNFTLKFYNESGVLTDPTKINGGDFTLEELTSIIVFNHEGVVTVDTVKDSAGTLIPGKYTVEVTVNKDVDIVSPISIAEDSYKIGKANGLAGSTHLVRLDTTLPEVVSSDAEVLLRKSDETIEISVSDTEVTQVYLVHKDVATGLNKTAQIKEALAAQYWTFVEEVNSTDGIVLVSLSLSGLTDGDYVHYTANASGQLSKKSDIIMTMDATQPTVTFDRSNVSTNGASKDGVLGNDDIIYVTVSFDENVYLNDISNLDVALKLKIGNTEGNAEYQAKYDSGHGTSTLTFMYTFDTDSEEYAGSNIIIPENAFIGIVTDRAGNKAVIRNAKIDLGSSNFEAPTGKPTVVLDDKGFRKEDGITTSDKITVTDLLDEEGWEYRVSSDRKKIPEETDLEWFSGTFFALEDETYETGSIQIRKVSAHGVGAKESKEWWSNTKTWTIDPAPASIAENGVNVEVASGKKEEGIDQRSADALIIGSTLTFTVGLDGGKNVYVSKGQGGAELYFELTLQSADGVSTATVKAVYAGKYDALTNALTFVYTVKPGEFDSASLTLPTITSLAFKDGSIKTVAGKEVNDLAAALATALATAQVTDVDHGSTISGITALKVDSKAPGFVSTNMELMGNDYQVKIINIGDTVSKLEYQIKNADGSWLGEWTSVDKYQQGATEAVFSLAKILVAREVKTLKLSVDDLKVRQTDVSGNVTEVTNTELYAVKLPEFTGPTLQSADLHDPLTSSNLKAGAEATILFTFSKDFTIGNFTKNPEDFEEVSKGDLSGIIEPSDYGSLSNWQKVNGADVQYTATFTVKDSLAPIDVKNIAFQVKADSYTDGTQPVSSKSVESSITVDTKAPKIEWVRPADGQESLIGKDDTLSVVVKFDEEVTLTKQATLTLLIEIKDGTKKEVTATATEEGFSKDEWTFVTELFPTGFKDDNDIIEIVSLKGDFKDTAKNVADIKIGENGLKLEGIKVITDQPEIGEVGTGQSDNSHFTVNEKVKIYLVKNDSGFDLNSPPTGSSNQVLIKDLNKKSVQFTATDLNDLDVGEYNVYIQDQDSNWSEPKDNAIKITIKASNNTSINFVLDDIKTDGNLVIADNKMTITFSKAVDISMLEAGLEKGDFTVLDSAGEEYTFKGTISAEDVDDSQYATTFKVTPAKAMFFKQGDKLSISSKFVQDKEFGAFAEDDISFKATKDVYLQDGDTFFTGKGSMIHVDAKDVDGDPYTNQDIGQSVNIWHDKDGENHLEKQSTTGPTLKKENSKWSVQFDNEHYLISPEAPTATDFTYFVVVNGADRSDRSTVFSTRPKNLDNGANVNIFEGHFESHVDNKWWHVKEAEGKIDPRKDESNILGESFNSGGDSRTIYGNGHKEELPSGKISSNLTHGELTVGAELGSSGWHEKFKGDIHEILYYDKVLNQAEIKVIQNYLSSKWNIGLAASSNSYDGDTDNKNHHDADVTGIVMIDNENQVTSASEGALIVTSSTQNGFLKDEGDAVFLGARGQNYLVNNSLASGTSVRSDKVWYMDVKDVEDGDGTTGGNIDLTFDLAALGLNTNGSTSDYHLLWGAAAGAGFEFNNVTAKTFATNDKVTFANVNMANLGDGYLTVGSNLETNTAKTWNNTVDVINGASGTDGQKDCFDFSSLGNSVTTATTITDFNTADGDVLDLSMVLKDYNYNDQLSEFIKLKYENEEVTLTVDKDGNNSGYTDLTITLVDITDILTLQDFDDHLIVL